jgi:uncharacterized protein YigA (DUF484 family)
MNANELADDIETQYTENGESLSLIAFVLRRQQAEIEDLKAKLQLHEAMDNQCASLMQQFRKAQEKCTK